MTLTSTSSDNNAIEMAANNAGTIVAPPPNSERRFKVAVCLSGSLRTFRESYPTFKMHVEDPNPQFDFEFF